MNWVDGQGKQRLTALRLRRPLPGHAPRHRGPARRKKISTTAQQCAYNRNHKQRLFASGLPAKAVNYRWKLRTRASVTPTICSRDAANALHLLALLLEAPRRSRHSGEICAGLGSETFFDFDKPWHSRQQNREALNDAADNPRYIESFQRGTDSSARFSSETARGHDVQGARIVEFVPVPAAKAWTDRKWRLAWCGSRGRAAKLYRVSRNTGDYSDDDCSFHFLPGLELLLRFRQMVTDRFLLG